MLSQESVNHVLFYDIAISKIVWFSTSTLFYNSLWFTDFRIVGYKFRFRRRRASLRGTRKTGATRKRRCRGNERARFIIRDADTLRLSPEVVLQEERRRPREKGNAEETEGWDARKRAKQKREWDVNGKSERGGEDGLELIQSRGGCLTTRSPWQEGEKQREITTPLLVIEIIRCQHSTSFTVSTFSLPPSSFSFAFFSFLVSSSSFFSLFIPDFWHLETNRTSRHTSFRSSQQVRQFFLYKVASTFLT